MSKELKDAPGFNLKEAWVIASVSVLVVYLMGQLMPDSQLGRMATPDWLLVWMFLLSLPSSLLAALLISDLVWMSYSPTPSEIIYIWAMLFVAGYWQWFAFVPWMMPKDQAMITLKLGRQDRESLDASGSDEEHAYDCVWIIEDERAAISASGRRADIESGPTERRR